MLTRWRIITLVAAGLAWLVGSGVGQEKQPKPDKESMSPFYQSFDVKKTREKFVAERWVAGRCRDAIRITPPGDWIKDLQYEGEMTEQEVKKLVDDLTAELAGLARAQKGLVADKRKATVMDRPVGVVRALFSDCSALDLWSLRGSYFLYRQEKSQGAVDILAARVDPANPKKWRVVCAVHEPPR